MANIRVYEDQCTKDYRKYADTVAVSFAVYHTVTTQLKGLDFVGIEHKLINAEGRELTPDIVVLCENEKKGLIFELKWSLPSREDLLEEEIKELEKYTKPCSNWKPSVKSVDCHDLVLVCHIDDVQKTVDMIKKLSNEKGYSFLKEHGFALWSWTITPPKGGERKEELRLFCVYGKTRNDQIEKLVQAPGGILIPEAVLTYLRFSLTFVKEKPPIQYTMTVLVQYILAPFQQAPEKKSYEIELDWIYEQMKKLFPSWHEFDTPTIQAKRSWIREALEKFWELRLIDKIVGKPNTWFIPIPTLRTRKPIQEVICRKLSKLRLKEMKRQKRSIGTLKPIRHKGPRKERPLTEYF
ncbi:MAG: hypothetical protein OEY22_02465 [Candidatus Bathyarchaeota archaeon]|nr:hypothetical protein [Candidatus Bathyarchaeota archaeon]MDH5786822.1 hypothetical protein [Candidatus Bathyarchaeota archaeon]